MIYPITSKCNQKCIFCSAYNRYNCEFNIDDFKNFINSNNDNLVVLSGGDPFCISPSLLLYILNLCIEKNKTIELQTNGSKIIDFDENILRKIIFLMKRTNGYFNINLSSHNKSIDLKITGLKNGFSKRIKGIKILNKFGAVIRVTHVINKLNYKYLPKFALFLLKNKNLWSWVQFSFVKGIGRASENKYIIPKYSEVSPYLIEAMEILNKNNFEFWVDHIPLCFLGKFYQRHVDYVKINKGIKGEYVKEKKKIKKCRGCSLFKFCSGPRIDYIKIYRNL
ncbi:MAG: radical SAM protein [Elusimicrobiales bacterium]|nr:radical SAM protein [Elusimicrobiales bacterium]